MARSIALSMSLSLVASMQALSRSSRSCYIATKAVPLSTRPGLAIIDSGFPAQQRLHVPSAQWILFRRNYRAPKAAICHADDGESGRPECSAVCDWKLPPLGKRRNPRNGHSVDLASGASDLPSATTRRILEAWLQLSFLSGNSAG